MTDVRQAVVGILSGLTETEQALLNGILRLERERLAEKKPHITADLLRVVRETVK